VQIVAVCGSTNVTIYEVAHGPPATTRKMEGNEVAAENRKNSPLNVRQAYIDTDEEEDFYCCAFGGRGINVESLAMPQSKKREWKLFGEAQSVSNKISDLSSYDGPQLLCVAGKCGVVKVIDTSRRALLQTLCGHGSEIYDLKFSSTDEWILATCSKDESLRLWNLQSATCIAILGGHNGHRDSVLSVSFSLDDKFLASGGMDTSIKLWMLDTHVIADAIEKSFEVKPRNFFVNDENIANITLDNNLKPLRRHTFQPLFVQTPYFSTTKIHNNYVDCVRFVGDLILSKSHESKTIVLWKPDFSEPAKGSRCPATMADNIFALREFSFTDCEIWYIRFDVYQNILACGNNNGEIKIWKINSNNKGGSTLPSPSRKAVRMVSFSPDGASLVAVCDDSTVYNWNAII